VTTPPPISRAGAQHDAHRELAKAIYRRQQDPLLVRAIKAVGHWLSSALDGVPATSGGGVWLALLVLGFVVVSLVVWRRVGTPRRSATAAGGVLAAGRAMTAAEHRALADAAAGRGDHETAVLEQMRAVVRALEERGVIEPRPGRTAAEVAREGGDGMPAATPVLVSAARVFDDVVYGGGSAGPDEVETLRAADRAVARR
jgi:Domain of unknown function (DUF4129)